MITTITLNVAIDKLYLVEELKPRSVNRVTECTYTAGGKGLNVSRVATIAGETVLATGFIGGYAGEYVVEQLNATGIRNDFVKVNGESRTCVNIIEKSTGKSTELLEPGFTVNEDDIARFIAKFESLLPQSDIVVLSGSAPKGSPTDIYARLITLAKAQGKRVLLDTSGAYLVEGIKAKPTLIKPNCDEISDLLGIEVSNKDEVIAAAKQLHEQGIEYVVVSLGKDGAIVACDEGVFEGNPPDVKVVNTVGCGDSMIASFAVGLVRGYPIAEMLNYAQAVSSANAMTSRTGFFYMDDLNAILDKGIVTKLED